MTDAMNHPFHQFLVSQGATVRAEQSLVDTNNPADFQDPSVRDSQLSSFTQEQSLNALNKAKSLVMAYWHGETLASTKDVANFYSVEEKLIRLILGRHLGEFHSDGVRKIEGQELRKVRLVLRLAPSASAATVWTPRAILRIGMLLQDNEIAKQVRNVLLDQVERNPNPQQLGLFDHEEDELPQQPVGAPTPAEIAEALELVFRPTRRVIALATAEAIAHQHPALKTTMSIAQKYLNNEAPKI